MKEIFSKLKFSFHIHQYSFGIERTYVCSMYVLYLFKLLNLHYLSLICAINFLSITLSKDNITKTLNEFLNYEIDL